MNLTTSRRRQTPRGARNASASRARRHAGAGSIERGLARREIDRVMRTVMDGAPTALTVPQLNASNAKKEDLVGRLALTSSPDAIELHPKGRQAQRRPGRPHPSRP